MLKVPHHYLQQLLLPPAVLGAEENLPEFNAEPTNISGRGNTSPLLTENTQLIMSGKKKNMTAMNLKPPVVCSLQLLLPQVTAAFNFCGQVQVESYIF